LIGYGRSNYDNNSSAKNSRYGELREHDCFSKILTRFPALSIVGPSIVVIGVSITALVYRGKEGESYSPLNQYISELGEVSVSRLSWLFNLSMILTGLYLIPACISLAIALQ